MDNRSVWLSSSVTSLSEAWLTKPTRKYKLMVEVQILPVQRGDLRVEGGQVATVVDDIVGDGEPLGPAGLGGEHRLGLICIDAIPGHDPLSLELGRDIHDQNAVQQSAKAGIFRQQRNHHQTVGGIECGQLGLHCSADTRMQNGLQRLPGASVGKYLLAQRAPVELAPGSQTLRTETLYDLGQGGLAGFDQLAGQYIGIDNRHAAAGEGGTDRRFAATDTAAETNDQHYNAPGPR